MEIPSCDRAGERDPSVKVVFEEQKAEKICYLN